MAGGKDKYELYRRSKSSSMRVTGRLVASALDSSHEKISIDSNQYSGLEGERSGPFSTSPEHASRVGSWAGVAAL